MRINPGDKLVGVLRNGGCSYPDVLLLVISAQFEEGEDCEAAPSCPGEPHSELGGEHLHEEPLGVNPLVLVDVVLSGVSTVLEPLRHLSAPNIEAECDEESSSEGHAAHEDARDHVDKRTEETAILVLVEEHTDPEMYNNVSIAL